MGVQLANLFESKELLELAKTIEKNYECSESQKEHRPNQKIARASIYRYDTNGSRMHKHITEQRAEIRPGT